MKLKPLAPAACARAGDDLSVRFIVRIFQKASLRRPETPHVSHHKKCVRTDYN